MPPRGKKLTSEAEMLNAIAALCADHPDIHTVRINPAHRSQRGFDNPGFPDLAIFGPAGILFRELKLTSANLRPAQTKWKYLLLGARLDWAIWTRADIGSGRVRDELTALAEPAAVADGGNDGVTAFGADAANARFARAMAAD